VSNIEVMGGKSAKYHSITRRTISLNGVALNADAPCHRGLEAPANLPLGDDFIRA
jgi:hypothetical protein